MKDYIFWKDDIYHMGCYGYYVNNQKKLLHRVKYEEYYGTIPKGYIIHHKNGDRSSNDIDNLQCMTASAHTKMHRTNKPWTDKRREAHTGIRRTSVKICKYSLEDQKLRKAEYRKHYRESMTEEQRLKQNEYNRQYRLRLKNRGKI